MFSPKWFAGVLSKGKDKSLVPRIESAIVESRLQGREFPRWVFELLLEKIENEASGSSESSLWCDMIDAYCGLIVGEKGLIDMTEAERGFEGILAMSDTSILYGRLLAVYDAIEKRSLANKGKARPTAAENGMRSFRRTPSMALRTILDKLEHHRINLRAKSPGLYNILEQAESDIWEMIAKNGCMEDSFAGIEADKCVDEKYMMGFFAQRALMKRERDARIAAKNSATNVANGANGMNGAAHSAADNR